MGSSAYYSNMILKESILYRKLDKQIVQCQTCAHYCVIKPSERGFCGVRENQNGKLYVLNYGKIIALNIDPIEKKPLFHFLPGSQSLSLASAGCNLACSNCQNWEISQGPRLYKKIEGDNIEPTEIIKIAQENNLLSISYTYTEPTIFLEYALEVMRLAKEAKIKNVWVSNGFMSPESAKLVIPYLDADNIDLKSFSDDFYQQSCGARLAPLLETLKLMKKGGVWLEITTLVIPTLTDTEENFRQIAKFIYDQLGAETPWHISRFSGAISWKLNNLPDTPIKTLKLAYKIGQEIGLKYIYVGNAPELNLENTYCPNCKNLLIRRSGYEISRFDKNGKCPKCHKSINIF